VVSAQEVRGLDIVASNITDSAPGKQIALFIAIDNYNEWIPLRYPVSDAIKIKNIIASKYWITETIELYNSDASKRNITETLNKLITDLCQEDSLFIYFAGHGYYDNLANMGYWIPTDGSKDIYSQSNWLSNIQIRSMLGKVKARHTLLISDSCFSGDLLNISRGFLPNISEEYFKLAYQRRSSQVLTSGAIESVPDQSQFSRALAKCLEENEKPYIDPHIIFNEIRLSMTSTTPLLGSLGGSESQEGGSFLLFLRENLDTSSKEKLFPPGSLNIIADNNSTYRIVGRSIDRKLKGSFTLENIESGLYRIYLYSNDIIDQSKLISINSDEKTKLDIRSSYFYLPLLLDETNIFLDGKKITVFKNLENNISISQPITPGEYKFEIFGKYPFSNTLVLNPAENKFLNEYVSYIVSKINDEKNLIQKKLKNRKTRITFGVSSVVLGFISTGVSIYSLIKGESWSQIYSSAQDTYTVNNAHKQIDIYKNFLLASLTVGGISFSSSIFLLKNPTEKQFIDTLQKLDKEIIDIQG
jgi:hypothetical protein